ncbi:MAG: ATP-dependent DNA helicase RecG [Litorilinea sp.]
MNVSAFRRLQRVIDLEEKQGWRNRAVIGGLAAMASRWQGDALAEDADAQQVDVIAVLLDAYDQVEPAQRPALAESLRAALDGRLDAAGLAAALAQAGIAPSAPADSATNEPSADSVADTPAGDAIDAISDNAQRATSGSPRTAQPRSTTAKTPRVAYARDAGVSDRGGSEDEDDYVAIPPPQPTHLARQRVKNRQPQTAATREDLDVPTTRITGIGKAAAELLEKLDLRTVRDLLWHFPARYDDYTTMRTIAQVEPGEQATIIANLWQLQKRKLRYNREMLIGTLADATGTMRATWYNKWLEKQLKPETTLRFSGKVGLHLGVKTFESPVFEEIDQEMVATGRITPVYPLTEGLSNNRVRTMLTSALEAYADSLADVLPTDLRTRYQLLELGDAVQQLHFPESHEALDDARRRVAFEEMLYVQIGVAQRRQQLAEAEAIPFQETETGLAQFAEALPFALTGAQQRVLAEVGRDLARPRPMTRLIQGDVGSGKTAVAAAAMYLATANGLQSAMLAPTQILAEQHFRNLDALLSNMAGPADTPLRVALLTGRVTGAARETLLAELAAGEIDVVVGTTALIQEQVQFAALGLVVVDEQHRFGVEQRTLLRDKGSHPHMLVMSATPIPRSLALTIYGDLDLSLIDELPPGRKDITTKIFGRRERERLYAFVHREAEAGRQAFIVYPLVEENENLDAGAATTAHAQLAGEVMPTLRVGLLHGRMSGSEKDTVMQTFAAGDYDVLVATTVIEVGIDVPNASTILIEDAERFGLAQLHQLRGRVGRGEHASYCALISGADSEQAQLRLQAVAELHDGFRLAEKDLELRGPGEFLGKRQSGMPALRFAELTDLVMITETRAAAEWLLAQPDGLAAYPDLAANVQQFWQGEGDIN